MNIRNIYNKVQKRRIYNKVLAALTAIAALQLTSCVKDDLHCTSHPDTGALTVTADWSDRSEGIATPDRWCMAIGGYTGEATTATHTPDYLFAPGDYTLTAWTPAEAITISGTTATARYTAGSNIGWLFAATMPVSIDRDCDHALTATMRQQVRQLNIVIEPEGDAADHISSITATLSGAAGSLNFATNTYGSPTQAPLTFRKTADGKWAATVLLLGIAGQSQKLSGTVTFADGNPQPLAFESDLTAALSGFNDGKTVALSIGGTVVTIPSSSGATATIDNWQQLSGWNVDAF